MTVPMLMMPPPTVRSRFQDWPLALKSIVGFWSFYAMTVVLRGLLAPNTLNAIWDKLPNIGVGIVVTGLIYAVIAGAGGRATLRRKTAIAAFASLIGAVAMSGTLSLLEGKIHSKEEYRVQAREGFVVVEKDNKIRIERSAQEPLVLTMPSLSEMPTMKRIRMKLIVSQRNDRERLMPTHTSARPTTFDTRAFKTAKPGRASASTTV